MATFINCADLLSNDEDDLVIVVPFVEDPEEAEEVACVFCDERENLRVCEDSSTDMTIYCCRQCYEDDQEDTGHLNNCGDDWSDDEEDEAEVMDEDPK